MKKITILVCLVIFTGITVIVPLFGTVDTYCYAQVKLFEKQKLDKKYIEETISFIKDKSYDMGNHKATIRSQQIRDLSNYDLSEVKDMWVNTLIDLLENDTNDRVRVSASYALGVAKDTTAISVLKKALDDDVVELRMEAAYSLVKFGFSNDEKVFSTLEDIIRGKNIETWNINGYIPEGGTPPEREQRIKLGLRQKAMSRIAFINTEKTKSLLEAMTKDPDELLSKSAEALLKRYFIKSL